MSLGAAGEEKESDTQYCRLSASLMNENNGIGYQHLAYELCAMGISNNRSSIQKLYSQIQFPCLEFLNKITTNHLNLNFESKNPI